MMKMQAYMMKHMPQMMPSPSTEQQKTIQLKMIAHLKKEFGTDADILSKL